MRMRFSDPVPDGAGLHDAATDVRHRDAADHRAIGFAKHDERIGSVGGDVLGIAGQPRPVRWMANETGPCAILPDARNLGHDAIKLNRIMISSLCLRMIFSENRFPLFRMMR